MSQLVCYVCCDDCRLVFQRSYFVVAKCLHIYFLFSKKQYKATTSAGFFLPQNYLFLFFIKNLFLWEQEHWWSEGSGILSLHTIETNGLSYIGRGAQSNFPTSAVRRFLSKDSAYEFQSRLYLFSPNLFFRLLYVIMHYSCAVN